MSNTLRVPCNTCHFDTRHEIQSTYEVEYPTEYENGQITYVETLRGRVLVCLGCGTPTYEQSWTAWGMLDEHGQQIWAITYFPPREVGHRISKVFAALPRRLSNVYDEVIQSYNSGQRMLCAIGLRCLIEGICAERGVVPAKPSRPSIEAKINGLVKILPEKLVANLHGFRFMGNRAAHELEVPGREDLALAIEVMEDLMNFLYHLDYKASRLHRLQERLPTMHGDNQAGAG